MGLTHNNTLQATFDPLPIFAIAKTGVDSNSAELRRYVRLMESNGWIIPAMILICISGIIFGMYAKLNFKDVWLDEPYAGGHRGSGLSPCSSTLLR